LPELPEGWIWTRIGQIAWVTKLAGFEFTKYFEYSDSGPVRVVRGLNVGFGNFKAQNFKYIDSSVSDALPRSQLHGGELLIAYVGTLGTAAILPRNGNRYHLGPNVGKVVIDELIEDARFVLFFLLSSLGQHLINVTSKAVTQSSLSMEQIRLLPVPLAPLIEQHRLVEEIENWFSMTNDVEKVVEQNLKRAESLRRSILREAFEGKLVPQDPSDEPADKLLQQIRDERAKSKVEKDIDKTKMKSKQLELSTHVK
jgi:type I restriction enzyme S subunit